MPRKYRRKKSRKPEGPGLSLFPFLAVLVCTMGVLIVLLVIVTKMADHRAQQIQAENTESTQGEIEELTYQRDIEKLRVQGLSEIRPKLQTRLEKQQSARAFIEAEINSLNEKALRLAAELRRLKQADQPAVDNAKHANQVAKLKSQLEKAWQQTEKLKSEIATQPKVYSVVPYQGIGGTNRRPIYIECTRDGIVFQPLGIQLTEQDFLKPVVTGNPFDSALLAIRQYWTKIGIAAKEKPYPLLIVRPDGAASYALARHAMKNWDDQFGYELVESEKKLDFGKSDPILGQKITEAIAQAKDYQNRVAQRIFRAALTTDRTQYGGSSGGYRASPTGGFVNEGSSLTPQEDGSLTSLGSNQEKPFDPSGSKLADQNSGQKPSGNSAEPPATKSSEAGQFNPSPHRSTSKSSPTTESPSMQALRNLQDKIKSGYAEQNSQLAKKQGAQGGQSRQSSSNSTSISQDVHPMAATRGANWALPTRTAGGTAYNRPIKIVCAKNELLLEPYAQSKTSRTRIPMEKRTDQSVERLVQTVWSIIDSWGVAGVNGYWKPELNFEVLPGGEQRYQQIKTLLRGSGLDVAEVPATRTHR